MKIKFFVLAICIAYSFTGTAQLGNLLKKKNDQKTNVANENSPPADNKNDTGGTGNQPPQGSMIDNKIAWENNFESNFIENIENNF